MLTSLGAYLTSLVSTTTSLFLDGLPSDWARGKEGAGFPDAQPKLEGLGRPIPLVGADGKQ